MVKLLGLSLCICSSIIVVIWGVRIAGQQSVPPGISQLHLMDCAPPCWIGIIPGLTTVEDAKAKLITAYRGQSELQFKDSGFADGPVSPNVVENAIEGNKFYLSVRLNISTLVDGKNETVQSIGLFETREDRSHYAPTVADILGSFGPPQWVVVDESIGSGSEITLKYNGLDVVFNSHNRALILTEYPRLYLGNQVKQAPSAHYRPWKGFGTLALGK